MVEPLRSFFAAELWSLISIQLISKRMDDGAKEVGDADGVYVMLEYHVWGKVVQYCRTVT